MKNTNKNSIRGLICGGEGWLAHEAPKKLVSDGNHNMTIEARFLVNGVVSGTIYGQKNGLKLTLDHGRARISFPGRFSALAPESLAFRKPGCYSVAAVLRSGKAELYIDGIRVVDMPVGGSGERCLEDFAIGEEFSGYITDLRLFSVSLSPDEIQKDSAGIWQTKNNCLFQADFSGEHCVDASTERLRVKTVKTAPRTSFLTACTRTGGGCAFIRETPIGLGTKRSVCGKFYLCSSDEADRYILYTAVKENRGVCSICLEKQDGKWLMCVKNGADTVHSELHLKPGMWNDFCVVFTGGSVKLYLDGMMVGEQNTGVPVWSGLTAIVGAGISESGLDLGGSFSGALDYLAEFDCALTETEIDRFVDNPPYLFETGLKALMYFGYGTPAEVCAGQNLKAVGEYEFCFLPGTVPADSPTGIARVLPTVEQPMWGTLPADEQWRLTAACHIAKGVLLSVMGIGMAPDIGEKQLCVRIIKSQMAKEIIKVFWKREVSGQEAVAMACTALKECVEEGISIYFPPEAAKTYFYGPAQAAYMAEHMKIMVETGAASAITERLKETLGNIWKTEQSLRQGGNGSLEVVSVCFNHGGDPAVGSVHFHTSASGNLPVSQVFAPVNKRVPVTGVMVPSKMADAYAEVVLKYTGAAGHSLSGTLWAVDRGNTKTFGDVSKAFTVLAGGSITVNLPLAGEGLPSDLNIKRTAIWELNCPELESPFLINCDLTVYTLFHSPLKPWAACEPPAPYNPHGPGYITTELLDFTAREMTAPGGESQFCAYLTERLNTCGLFAYDTPGGGACHYTEYDRRFKYLKFIRDLSLPGPHLLNCTDCATILSSLAAMAGIRLPMLLLTDLNGNRSGYRCNQIQAITEVNPPTVWSVPFPAEGGGFLYHQVNTDGSSGLDAPLLIYDACLKVDVGLRPGEDGSIMAKKAEQPVAMAAQETWDAAVHVPPHMDYTGRFYRERLVCDGQEAAFLQGKFDVPGLTAVLTRTEDNRAEENVSARFEEVDTGGYGEYLRALRKLYFPDISGKTATKEEIRDDNPEELYKKLNDWGLTLVESDMLERTYRLTGLKKGNPAGKTALLKPTIREYVCVPGQSPELLMARVLSFFTCPKITDLKDTYGERSIRIGENVIVFLRRYRVYAVTAGCGETATAIAEALNS